MYEIIGNTSSKQIGLWTCGKINYNTSRKYN